MQKIFFFEFGNFNLLPNKLIFCCGNSSQKYSIKYCSSEVDASTVKINALISSWQQKYSNSKAPGCTVNNSLPKAMEVGGNHLGLTPLHTVGFLDFMISLTNMAASRSIFLLFRHGRVLELSIQDVKYFKWE